MIESQVRGPLDEDYGIGAMQRHIQENDAPIDFRGRLTLFAAFGSDADLSKLMKQILRMAKDA